MKPGDKVCLKKDYEVGDRVWVRGTEGTVMGTANVIESHLGRTKSQKIATVMVLGMHDSIEIPCEFLDIVDDFSSYMNPPQESEDDLVNHPSHYETGKFECIEVMQEALGYDAVRGFCVCNAFKYLYRHKRKNGDEDIKKAQWYLNKYVEITEDAEKNGLTPM